MTIIGVDFTISQLSVIYCYILSNVLNLRLGYFPALKCQYQIIHSQQSHIAYMISIMSYKIELRCFRVFIARIIQMISKDEKNKTK